MRRRSLALVASFLLHAGTASAAPRAPASTDDHAAPASASAATSEAAKARFNEGVKHYARKRYDRALAAFVQAYALTSTPAILFNLGMTSVKLGEPLRAVRYFEQFLRDASNATPEQRARAEAAIARAKEGLGSIEIIAPDGADIAVDGEPAGRAPLDSPVATTPGGHAVTITTAAGSKVANVEVKAGMVARLKLASVGSATPPASSGPVSTSPAETGDEAASKRPAAPVEPEPEPAAPGLFSPPGAMAPVYASGVIGIGGLTVAIILRGIGANADRNLSVGVDALQRSGKDATACTGNEGGSLAVTCSSLRSALRSSASVKAPFAASLAVGAAGTLFALGWYMFAPKSAPRVGASGLIVTF